MKNNNISQSYSNLQIFSLTILRVLIGWHFLYEGFAKLFSVPAWSAKFYLLGSVGPFSPTFKAMASHPVLLNLIDNLNIWGLILIGLSLFIGLFSRFFWHFYFFDADLILLNIASCSFIAAILSPGSVRASRSIQPP